MIRRLKQFYKNMAIQKKITTVFIVSFVFFLVLVLVGPNVVLYHSNIAKVKQNIQDECKMLSLQITNLYHNLRNCQNSTIQGINQAYKQWNLEETDEISFVATKNSLFHILNYYRSCFAGVDSIVFMDTRKNVVSAGLTHTPGEKEVTQMIAKIPAYGPVNTVHFPVEKRRFFGGNEESGILTQGVRVINIDTGENLGYLFVNVKTETIANLFPNGQEEIYHKSYYIIDEKNRIVVTQRTKEELLREVDKDLVEKIRTYGKNSFQTSVNREKILITSRTNPSLPWMIVNEIPMKDIMKDLYYMTVMIVAIAVICIVLAAVFILVLSRVITNPIQNLTDMAARISSGELTCRCTVDRADEVGVLSKTFNAMVERIQKLLVQVKEEQKQKRETELALLQVQIKPHFLYNTLDLIYVCCEMEDGKVGGKIAKALADYYRTCLSGGNEVVSVGEELRNIENYLFIQKERYCDIITYSIEAPQECRTFKIPKMTLQPLIENAIYHGIKEKDGQGCVTVWVRDQGDALLLGVEDDGIGMTAESFQKILSRKDERGKQHFGLKNVHERIQLYFGEEYGLEIENGRNEGTCIFIRIPKIEAYYD